ncbi:hypothetical protein [Novosphingobium kaempferiae]|uniref:hypothetical protein n=1 Tax=Novosphingobium kaempferiae TaxID=2896849 RepID=UPI001E4303D2|nr:hypothetical protein [Novosphingobium kaempferiae]
MGPQRFETIFDYTRQGVDVGVRCACGHGARLDRRALSRTCITNGLDTRMPAIKARLKCRAGGSRDVGCSSLERD